MVPPVAGNCLDEPFLKALFSAPKALHWPLLLSAIAGLTVLWECYSAHIDEKLFLSERDAVYLEFLNVCFRRLILCGPIAAALLTLSVGQAAWIDPQQPTVLITGSNRGIGLAFVEYYLAEGWNVLATARSPESAGDLQRLGEDWDNLVIEQLDVTDESRVKDLAADYSGTPIDLLINNAGVYGGEKEQNLGSLDPQTFHDVMAVNVLAPMQMIEAFMEHVAASRHKKIVSITSGAGSVSGERVSTGGAFYSISKAALNMAMRKAGAALEEQGIVIALIAPGIVVTDMLQKNRPNLVSRANSPAESVAGMAAVIARIDRSYNKQIVNYDGSVVAW